MRCGCRPLCGIGLNQALRYARSGTAKGRGSATCWAAQVEELDGSHRCKTCGPRWQMC